MLENSNHGRGGVAILIPDRRDIMKKLFLHTRWIFHNDKGLICLEDVTIINMHT